MLSFDQCRRSIMRARARETVTEIAPSTTSPRPIHAVEIAYQNGEKQQGATGRTSSPAWNLWKPFTCHNGEECSCQLFNYRVARIDDIDYGQDFENHPSIIAILEHFRDINMPLSFDFHFTNYVQVEKLLKDVNASKSSGHDMLPPRAD